MDATTSRRIGNFALALAILILLVGVGGKFGLLPQIAHLRELYMVALVLVIVARVLRRRGRELRPGD
jgi:ACR3 family arsenite efflux pump ArsB